MNEISNDKMLGHVSETLLHKSYVIVACLKMSKYLVSIGKDTLALMLLQRANMHDNSKLIGPELELLSSIYGNQDAFINPSVQLTTCEKDIIEKHWENNRHHPEHFKNVENMTELDIVEMVCDWYARSLQYGTDFLEFVKTRQETRFHFPNEMFEGILKYCIILNEGVEKMDEKKVCEFPEVWCEGESEVEVGDNPKNLKEYSDFAEIELKSEA